jgi:hypothetical protein
VRYHEDFNDGPGGWYGWVSNAQGPKPLEIRDSCALSRSPWWIDYNHAPPGAGYMHLLYALNTGGRPGEYQREVEGPNRFLAGGYPTNFVGARVSVRLRGEMEMRGTRMYLLCQAQHEGICSGWLLTGRPLEITTDWSEQTLTTLPEPEDWTCLGSRHDRADFYGYLPLPRVLAEVNVDILFVLYPLDIAPMGPWVGDPHRLRPERDYPVWRGRLPEGYVLLDHVDIDFA